MLYDRCYMGRQGDLSMMAGDCWMSATLMENLSSLRPVQEKKNRFCIDKLTCINSSLM